MQSDSTFDPIRLYFQSK